ncbi:PilZ domain-containing protein [Microvirga aerilata]|uniref:PilZ domain-containing protein n=1 Tax=Microvirga aerilata TaxID=670292 RepID=UPI00362A87DC
MNRPTSLSVHRGSQSSAPVRIYSPSGKRVHPRFDVPFTVEIAGSRYPGTNLSLGGIGLAGPSLSASEGEVFKAAMSFAFATHEVRVPAHLVAVRWDVSNRATAFQFLDLNMDTARVFQTITDRWASGDLLALESIITPDGHSSALTLPSSALRGLRRLGLVIRYSAALAAGGAMAWWLGGLLYDRWVSIVPEHAAVASEAILVQAPVSGYYRERASPGSHLRVHDEIGNLVPLSPQRRRPNGRCNCLP